MEFHERLKELRLETGFSQKEFADEFGIENSKYNKWENGKNKPDFDTVCMLAKHFDVPTDYLMGIADIRNSKNQFLITELGLSEEAIDVLKSLGSIRVKEFSEHDQRTLLNVLDDMLALSTYFKDMLQMIGLASSQENFVEQQNQHKFADKYPEEIKKFPVAELQFFKHAKDGEALLHTITHELYEIEEWLFNGPERE
jgi:transcriptional regulator with XRE-family HTH domain